MDFSQVAAEFRKLKAQYDAGALSEADFKARLQDLMIQDEQGRWWMIGSETGQWYVHDREKWVRGEPLTAEAAQAPAEVEPVKPISQPSAPVQATAQPPAPAQKLWLRVGAGIIGVALLAFLISRVFPGPTPTPTATASPTPSATLTATPSPTATASPSPTATPTLSPTATRTFSPTATRTFSPTATRTFSPTATRTFSPTATWTFSPTATWTPIVFGVTGISASVNPSSFSGACPAVFNFTANITASAAGTVTYQWERSDGASGPVATVVFAAAESRTINTTWTLGASGTFWQRLRVLSPKVLVSNTAPFTLECAIATGPLLFADAKESPGRISRLDGGAVSTVYTRPSGQIHSLARAGDGSIYFCDANRNAVYHLTWAGPPAIVYTHSTYVREVEIGPGGAVYFSEATGAGGDGIVYRLDGMNATPFYRVRLSDVDGSWAGTFAFDGGGDLWLSSGNQVPAYLYHVVGGTPQRVYTARDGAIMGFAFEPTGNLIYADHQSTIVRLVLPAFARQVVQVVPSAQWLSDVVLAAP